MSHRPPSEFEIASFEQALGYPLPSDYRQMLLHTNGGSPEISLITLGVRKLYVQAFYPLKLDGCVNVFTELEVTQSQIPSGFFPIGLEGGGGYIFLDARSGHVYCESDGECLQIAECLSQLLEKLVVRASVAEIVPPGQSDLSFAGSGDLEGFDLFLSSGGDLNVRDSSGHSIAELAVIAGERRILQKFIDLGGNLSGALRAAMRIGAGAPMIDYLLAQGTDPKEKDASGKTPGEHGSQFFRNYLRRRCADFSLDR